MYRNDILVFGLRVYQVKNENLSCILVTKMFLNDMYCTWNSSSFWGIATLFTEKTLLDKLITVNVTAW